MMPCHDHNESKAGKQIMGLLEEGKDVALISDAGTPLLSDPGFRLVRLAIEHQVRIVPLPGPSSIVTALSVAGIATDRFVFEGFLPARQPARIARLNELSTESRTLVFFESSHRIKDSLADLGQVLGPDRQLAVCRELTKQFETILRGSIEQVRAAVEADNNQQKGEFVLVVAGSSKNLEQNMANALNMSRELQEYLSASQSARVAAKLCGVSRRDLYEMMESGEQGNATD